METEFKLVETYRKIVFDPNLGTVSQIDEKIQDVGEYELILTMRLRDK